MFEKIKASYAIAIILICASFTGSLLLICTNYYNPQPDQVLIYRKKSKKPMAFEKIERPKPKPVSMDRLKKQGCVADGLLSEYNPDREEYISLINRSNCYYLHRAVETWLTPPDFDTIQYVMSRMTKKDLVYGMFIAEAIKTNADYANDDEKTTFDFKKMCQAGSENIWGEHSCKPDFGSGEYRNYLQYITQEAMDLGIQSFMFGQVYFQENGRRDRVIEVVKEMRAYAKKQGVNIVVGAQTGKITDPSYLKLFDYI
jgi:hypothetical protein